MEYRYGSHTIFKTQYHFVFVTKYRYPILKEDVSLEVRELIRQTCTAFELEILKGVVSRDHVKLLVSVLPNMAPSEIMRRVKERSSSKLFEKFPELKRCYWGRHFWARGYFCVWLLVASLSLQKRIPKQAVKIYHTRMQTEEGF